MNINNVPSYAKDYKYWVVRDCGKDGFMELMEMLKLSKQFVKLSLMVKSM